MFAQRKIIQSNFAAFLVVKSSRTLSLKVDIDKIGFPPSVIKVNASNTSMNSGMNLIVVTKTFPSQKSRWMKRYLKGMPLSFTALDKLYKCMCPMFRDILRNAGIPGQMPPFWAFLKISPPS